MEKAVLTQRIVERINELGKSKGMPSTQVSPGALLLGGSLPIDSLDLASLLVQLEAETGRDPFQNGFVEFQTVEELATLYSE